jgi:hypothetical protein
MSKFGTSEFAADFAKLMNAWNKLEDLVKQTHPGLTPDEQYQLTSAAMSKMMGLDTKAASNH